jgi:cytochrome bd-type quinol oxidase subunit 2
MWSLGTSPAIFLLVGFIIGLAIFVGTLVSVWTNRADATTQRAAKASALISLLIGLSGLLHWIVFEKQPIYSPETLVVLVLYAAPTFVICFYVFSSRIRRSLDHNGKK